MQSRITITLSPEEKAVLQALSAVSLRWPREEVRFLIREEGKRRGLFRDEPHETDRVNQLIATGQEEAQR
jgi:hypothetical protein